MARKTEKARAGKSEARGRWTVRGVPAKLQKAAGDAARARSLTLGQWLTAVLDEATRRDASTPRAAVLAWEEAVERRLARLEALAGVDEPLATAPAAAGPQAVT